MASKSFSSFEKELSAAVSFGPKASESVLRSAWRNELLSFRASSAILSSVFSPMPLAGSFRIRLTASSLRGFAIAVR